MDPYYKDLAKSLGVAFGCLLVLVIVFHFAKPLFLHKANRLPAAVYPSTIVTLVNAQRLAYGLAPLSENAKLDEAAQLKAQDMVTRGYYAHVSPDGKTPLYFLDEAGYRYLNVGENLVVRVSDSDQAVDAWMNSPDHRSNILRSDFTETGVAIAQGEYDGKETYYVVQIFAKPYPRTVIPVPAPVAKPVRAETVKPAPAATTTSAAATTTTVTKATAAVPETKSFVEQVETLAKPIAPVKAVTMPESTTTATIAVASSTPAPAVSIDTNNPISLTEEPNTNGISNAALIGQGELITRPETAPSETRSDLEVFVYFAKAKFSNLFEN